jgi:2-methylcitrate dehydratase PrpD
VNAQFSLPYTVAAAIVRGQVFLEDFEAKRILDQKVRSLAGRVHVTPDADLAAKDILQSQVVIAITDGRTFEEHVACPLGNPSNPMALEQCIDKFNRCLVYHGWDPNDRKVKQLLSMIEDLDLVDDINPMMALLVQ